METNFGYWLIDRPGVLMHDNSTSPWNHTRPVCPVLYLSAMNVAAGLLSGKGVLFHGGVLAVDYLSDGSSIGLGCASS